ncbi:MAG: RNA-directed DNA polymerase [Candidatus Dormibacteria bacterium]
MARKRAGDQPVRITPATVRAANPPEAHLPPLWYERLGGAQMRSVCQTVSAGLDEHPWRTDPAHFVSVPKRFGGLRPVAVLSLSDRVRYEALVRSLEPHIDRALCGPTVLYGPRGHDRTLRWLSFERAILRGRSRYVVTADVADFHASLDRGMALDVLRRGDADRHQIDRLERFLDLAMDGRGGLPQSYRASSALGSLCLADLDRFMSLQGRHYIRCQDDIRISVRDLADAEDALSALKERLASLRLSLRTDKTEIAPTAEYQRLLHQGSRWEIFMWSRLAPVIEGGSLDHWLRPWGEALLGRIRSGGNRAVRARRTVAELLDSDSPSPSVSQCRAMVAALAVLRTTRDPALSRFAPGLIARFPSELPTVARSLTTLLRTPGAAEARTTVVRLLLDCDLGQGVRAAWLFWVLRSAAGQLPRPVIDQAAEAAGSDETEWVCRVQAAWLLAQAGAIDERLLARLRESAPIQLSRALPGEPFERTLTATGS